MANREWTVGWKPIDQANSKPHWSGVRFDCFNDADRAARMLNASDPESHYFPSLLADLPLENCVECGKLTKKTEMKPNPYKDETGMVCISCYENGVGVMEANSTGLE